MMNIFRTSGRNGVVMALGVLVLLFLAVVIFYSGGSLSWADRVPESGPLPLFGYQNREILGGSKATEHPDMRDFRLLGKVKRLPTTEELQKVDDKLLMYIYHSYLDNTDYRCHRKLRLGKVGDGGWEVCDDYEFRPLQPCVVYSFGIHDDFSFDDEAGRLYGCDVFSFDPSMESKNHQRSEKVRFYNLGLGGSGGISSLPFNTAPIARKEGWRIETLSSIKALLKHHNETIDILKMDIELSEWPALADILATGELTKVRQLLIEYHLPGSEAYYVRHNLPILSQIEALGFRRYYTHLNPMCEPMPNVYTVNRTGCYELYYVNTHFAPQHPSR
ncbi:probable methyltransferase-like protein 24 [Littorina saxatilis]|uniref:Methyltransferase domain-containing protein n=1 Tax=Littorina saxatilis TaxID=31220 RepID=A0AAN9AQE9_9CAEN